MTQNPIFNQEVTAELQRAARRLIQNPDFATILTALKNDCIQDFKQVGATEQQICEAHRRYIVADELEMKVKHYGNQG